MNPLLDLMNWLAEIINEATVSIWQEYFLLSIVRLNQDSHMIPEIYRVQGDVHHMTTVAFVMIVAIGGVIVMTHESLQTQYSLREVLPRLVVGFLVSHMTFQIVGASLRYSDDIVTALLSIREGLEISSWSPPPEDLLEGVAYLLSRYFRGDHGTTLTSITLLLLMLIASIILLVSAILRGIIAAGLIMIAPACLAGHALPQTESMARWWWRMWAACHMSVIGQAAVLNLWSRVAFTEEGFLNPPLGTVNEHGLDMSVVYLLIAVWATWKVHALAFQWARGRPVRFPGSRLAMAIGGMVAWRGINSLGRKKQKPNPGDATPASTTGRRSSQIAPSYTKVGGSRKLQVPAGPMASRTPGLRKPGDPATSPPNWSVKPKPPKKGKARQKSQSGRVIPPRHPSPTVVPANAPKGRPPAPPPIPANAPKRAAVPPRTAPSTPKRPGVVPPVLPPRSTPPPSNPSNKRKKKGGAP